MNCLEREKLFEYVRQWLEPLEGEAVRAHIEGCDACRAAVAEYERLGGVLSEWKAPKPSPWFDARLRARLASEKEDGLWGAWGFLEWRRWLLPATVVAFAVLALVMFFQSPREPQPVASEKARPAEARRPTEVAQAEKPVLKPLERPEGAEAERLDEDGFSALEDYDLIANFDVLSELPSKGKHAVR
jgi:anti-sigma factor RsiW